MISDKTLVALSLKYPDKKNANPWKPESEIACSNILNRYQSCKETDLSNPVMAEECKKLKRFTFQCYTLEPKYYREYLRSQMTESEYFDRYMAKVGESIQIVPRKEVWKPKIEGEDTGL